PPVAPSPPLPSQRVANAEPQVPASTLNDAPAVTRESPPSPPPDALALTDRPAPPAARVDASNDARSVPAAPAASRVASLPAAPNGERLPSAIAAANNAASEATLTIGEGSRRDVDGIQRALQRYEVAYEHL